MSKLSLRTRLLLAVGAIVLVALGVTGIVVYGSLSSYLYNQVDNTLNVSHRAVEMTAEHPGEAAGSFVPSQDSTGGPVPGRPGAPSSNSNGLPGAPGSPGASAFCAAGLRSAPAMFIEVRTATGTVVTGAAGKEQCPAFLPGNSDFSPMLPLTITGLARSQSDPDELVSYFTTASTSTAGPQFRVRASTLSNGDVLILATPIASVASTLSQLQLVELLVSVGALVAALLLGLWLVRVGLRPLRDVERTAEAISGGELMHRVPNANSRTEVGHLATAFNIMLERIEELITDLRSSEGRLRRFVGDASHELRTPIAAVSAYTQLFREGAASRREDLARAMGGIERETTRMSRLVEDLLTLAKLDEHRDLESEPVELVGLCLEAVETARTVGAAWPITVVANEAVEVLGDYGALRQVVDNLLANVHAHTPPGSATTLTVGQSDGQAVIEIVDDGPGMTEEQARLVFERFFRADPSRSRETGGSGLGLAIVASIVAAHHGAVTGAPHPGGGAVFRLTLPVLKDEERPT